jgi:uncharacterized iron-regulated membrane protein
VNLRKSHRLISVIIALPLLVITSTGIILQMRNRLEWIQPSAVSAKSEAGKPLISLEELTHLAGPGVDQIIYRPEKNNLSIRMKDGMDLQINPQTGEILKKAKRHTSLLIEIHQGSWLGPFGQNFIYFLTGLGLLYLLYSGLVIWKRGRFP